VDGNGPPPLEHAPPAVATSVGAALRRRMVAGALVGFALGAVDGALAWLRTPRAELGLRDLAPLLGYGASTVGVVVLLVGVFHTLVAQAVAARGALRDAGAYLREGPRRWFQRDERAALRAVMLLVGAGVAAVVGYRLALGVIRGVRTPTLAALSLVGLSLVSLVSGAVAGLVAGLALEGPLRRSKRLASPGAVALVTAVAAVFGGLVAAVAARAVLARLSYGSIGASLVAAVVYAMADRLTAHRRKSTSWVPVAMVAGVALVSLTWSGAGLGRSQPVLAAITRRSLLAGAVIPRLQRWSDFDGDGHGRWFGGGDCNDRDRRINPLARDIPGNGRDENCTGFDAPPLVEDRATAYVAPATARPSVVLVSIDTARPDHTSLYGYRRPTTPTLDRLAAGGARFDRAYTAVPQTVRSFASAFTGRYPTTLCWGRDPQFPPLRDPNEMIAESLRDAGYATSAFTNTSYFALTAGFFQGFDVIEQGAGFKDDARVTTWKARLWLERAAQEPRPFFTWVHLVDPHEPYTDRTEPTDFGHEPGDRYDEEIAWADHALASLTPTIEEVARARPLLIVVMSDHGEAFGEHGAYYHSYDAHEEALRVVLAVRGPGVVPGARAQLVSLIDLQATLLGYIDRAPPPRSPSRSLIPLLQSPPGAVVPWRSAVLAEVGNAREFATAVVAPPWKLVHDASRGAWELFQIDRDPSERRNVYNREPVVAEQLRARMSELTRPGASRCPAR